MTPADDAEVEHQIDLAAALAARGDEMSAAQAFALARSLAVSLLEPGVLQHRIEHHDLPLDREREQYRRLIAAQRSAPHRLVVVGDSLGLPRPDDKSGPHLGAERTYPFLLLDRRPDHEVDSYCRRYYTTRSALDVLHADTSLGVGDDVVIHLGLNDCASRMFLEDERLALDLLPAATKDKIVAFAQRHRRSIVRYLPERHYVPPDEFRSNLDALLERLHERGARRVVLATIILPPVRFWPATPGLQRNYARYNLMVMDAAHRHDAALFDIDRHVWDRQHDGVLLPDGMHLAEGGHHLFADQVAALLA